MKVKYYIRDLFTKDNARENLSPSLCVGGICGVYNSLRNSNLPDTLLNALAVAAYWYVMSSINRTYDNIRAAREYVKLKQKENQEIDPKYMKRLERAFKKLDIEKSEDESDKEYISRMIRSSKLINNAENYGYDCIQFSYDGK
jgi:hypothetical protein